MNKNFKRIAAYMIDTILVTALATLLINIKQINFQLEDYNDVAKDYSKISEKHEDIKEDYEEAKEKYDDKKISKKEYKKVKNEYDDFLDNYEVKIKKMSLKLTQSNTVSYIIQIAFIVGYFVIFQYLMGGQTVGKRIMKLRVVKNGKKELGIFNYLIRAIILNGIVQSVALIICSYTCGYNSFYNANYIITNITSIIEIVILMMVFMNKESRGLHDIIAGTKVIEIDKNGKEVEYIPPKKEEVK